MKSRCASRMAALLLINKRFNYYLSLFVILGVSSKLHPVIDFPLQRVEIETMRNAL